MFRLIPARLHRSALRIAHRLRHRWRVWRGTPLLGCSVIVTNSSNSILMLRHHYGPDYWALPGGGIGRNELPAVAARRELGEEVGMNPAELKFVAVIEEEISGSPHSCHIFTVACDAHPIPDGREIAEAKFFPAHSLPYPMSGFAQSRLEAWRRWCERGN